MHGPIQSATRWLEKPLEPAAIPLLQPFHQGQLFHNHWAFTHALRGPCGQIILVIEDTHTGGHAELHLFAKDNSIQALASSEHFDIILNNGGNGKTPTPKHLRQLANALSELLKANENNSSISWSLPTLSDATAFAVR